MSRYLCIKLNRNDVLREVQAGRGFVDILVRGVPVELKVFKGQVKLEALI